MERSICFLFDESCEETSNSKQFVKTATDGNKLGRDVELQNTHIVLFKSSRDVLKINTLSQHLGLGSQLKEWYQDATSVPYGHLLIDLPQKSYNILFTSWNTDKVLDTEYTIRHYSLNFSKIFPKPSKTIDSQLSKRFH